MKLSNDMIMRLMAAGLTKAQATSTAAEVAVNLFMPNDGKALMAEAKKQVDEMRQQAFTIKRDIASCSETLKAIVEAKDKYGQITDERAIQAIALYGALLQINERQGVEGDESAKSAGYIVYAYLGGQARQID